MQPPTTIRRTLAFLLCLLAGCRTEGAPVLRVENVGFTTAEAGDLSQSQLEELADLAALGVAIARDEIEELTAPLAGREVERSRLATLPLHLGALRQGLSEPALREAYAAAPEWELTVRHLVRLVPRRATAAQRDEARRIAAEAAARAHAGEDLASLAAALSEEPGAPETGGLLRPGRAGSWVEPFWEAALALGVGEVSGVVETEYGYHVIRLEDRRPLPFEEAPRLPLLRRLVPAPVAMLAMEEWAATRPPVPLDEDAVLRAREDLLSGCLPAGPDLVTGSSGRYTARDLGLAWVALPAAQQQALRDATGASFFGWAADDAREMVWARAAEGVGAPPAPESGAAREWSTRLHRVGAALGFEPGMDPTRIARLSLGALASRGQEARIARAELIPFRPLLRATYRFDGLVASCAAASSTSEMRKSENTR
jgi:hypothetical protein